MSNRIELTLSPSSTAGLIASLPWVVLAVCTVIAAQETSLLLTLFVIPALALGRAAFQRFGLLNKPNSIVAVSNDTTGLTCRLANGHELPVKVTNASFMSPGLAILQFKTNTRKSGRMMTIITGNLGALKSNTNDSAFRRLRMLLRTGSTERGHNTSLH
ncbi:MAG: hypothetical protein ABJM19_07945 [Marinobacter sp.]|uniref:hypothetical protein n=1 Tax=unclassified Marinobacter TaxID=83889 RepID=UPI00273B4872|nr:MULTISPECIES: hypothetical protein [unclassified Marinobacter]MDP4548437.1 hypothetical protein [Marinobacter sp. MDS2]